MFSNTALWHRSAIGISAVAFFVFLSFRVIIMHLLTLLKYIKKKTSIGGFINLCVRLSYPSLVELFGRNHPFSCLEL